MISLSCPKSYSVDRPDAVWLARSMNDRFAAARLERPDRLKGLPSLPLTAGMSEALKEVDRLPLPAVLRPMEPLPTEHMRDFGLAPMVGSMFETTLTVDPMVYAGLFDRHPNSPRIAPHLGGTPPYLTERLSNRYGAYGPNYDYAPHPPSHYSRRLYYGTVFFPRLAQRRCGTLPEPCQ